MSRTRFLLLIALAATALLLWVRARSPVVVPGYFHDTPHDHPVLSHYDSLIGLADMRAGGQVCLSIPVQLDSNVEITIVAVPLRGSHRHAPFVAKARVTRRFDPSCSNDALGVGVQSWGDSLYSLTLARTGPDFRGPFFGVASPAASVVQRGDSVKMHALDGTVLSFDECTSQEGVHLSVWVGPPLKGKRVSHKYYYLPFSTEATCQDGET